MSKFICSPKMYQWKGREKIILSNVWGLIKYSFWNKKKLFWHMFLWDGTEVCFEQWDMDQPPHPENRMSVGLMRSSKKSAMTPRQSTSRQVTTRRGATGDSMLASLLRGAPRHHQASTLPAALPERPKRTLHLPQIRKVHASTAHFSPGECGAHRFAPGVCRLSTEVIRIV